MLVAPHAQTLRAAAADGDAAGLARPSGRFFGRRTRRRPVWRLQRVRLPQNDSVRDLVDHTVLRTPVILRERWQAPSARTIVCRDRRIFTLGRVAPLCQVQVRQLSLSNY